MSAFLDYINDRIKLLDSVLLAAGPSGRPSPEWMAIRLEAVVPDVEGVRTSTVGDTIRYMVSFSDGIILEGVGIGGLYDGFRWMVLPNQAAQDARALHDGTALYGIDGELRHASTTAPGYTALNAVNAAASATPNVTSDLPSEAETTTVKTLCGPTVTAATWTNAYGAKVTIYDNTVEVSDGCRVFRASRAEALNYAKNALPPTRIASLEETLQAAIRDMVIQSDARVDFGEYGDGNYLTIDTTLDKAVEDVSRTVEQVLRIIATIPGSTLAGIPTPDLVHTCQADDMTVSVSFRIAR